MTPAAGYRARPAFRRQHRRRPAQEAPPSRLTPPRTLTAPDRCGPTHARKDHRP